MTQSLGMRATSFGASAVLLGLMVFAGLSATITMQLPVFNGPAPIPVETLSPQPAPRKPVVRQQTKPPPDRPIEGPARGIETTAPARPDRSGLNFGPPVPPLGPSEITNPRWLRQPRDLASYYPARALAREIPGQVVLDCRVDVVGALHCAVVSETPANWGFGRAALEIAGDYRMVPAMRDGQAIEGRYRMRVPFEVR